MSAGHVYGASAGRRVGDSAPIVKHRANVVVVAQALWSAWARTNDLTDPTSAAQRASGRVPGGTFRPVSLINGVRTGQP